MKKIIFYMKRLRSKFFPVHHVVIAEPKLIMTLLVKNEQDVLEENILFHKSMGVDGFVITNNNSTDNTSNIIQKYVEKGWIYQVIFESGNNYDQVAWVDRMVRIAKEQYNADWIINADADEFWYSRSGSLKNEISKTQSNIISCNMKNMVVPKDGNFLNAQYVVEKAIHDGAVYGLSKFNIYTPQIPKVIHRTVGYILIAKGNHNAEMEGRHKIVSDDISIYHFSIRGRGHFYNKFYYGGEAASRKVGLKVGESDHFIYYFKGFSSGLLDPDNEYEKHVGLSCIDKLIEEGVVVKDMTIKNYFDRNALL